MTVGIWLTTSGLGLTFTFCTWGTVKGPAIQSALELEFKYREYGRQEVQSYSFLRNSSECAHVVNSDLHDGPKKTLTLDESHPSQ